MIYCNCTGGRKLDKRDCLNYSTVISPTRMRIHLETVYVSFSDQLTMHRKTRVNHLTHLSHSGLVHGQNDSKMCENESFCPCSVTHYGSNESNDSLGVFSVFSILQSHISILFIMTQIFDLRYRSNNQVQNIHLSKIELIKRLTTATRQINSNSNKNHPTV